MIPISLDKQIAGACPNLRLGCIQSKVSIANESKALWEEIDEQIIALQNQLGEIPAIAKLPAIRETRKGYKQCGKDPARYRPSAESLLRRVMQGKGLYTINNVVDLLNLVSIRSGFSIGGYDAAKIQGSIKAGIGGANEPYEGIGRGELNIEYLPLLRDEQGAFGSPTSDSQRTSVSLDTQDFLMVFFAFGKEADLEKAMKDAEHFLLKYAGAQELKSVIL